MSVIFYGFRSACMRTLFPYRSAHTRTAYCNTKLPALPDDCNPSHGLSA